MQLEAYDHFREIIQPAIADYGQAEVDLSRAVQSADQQLIRQAGLKALRLGGAAALYLHHFADIIAARPPSGFPDFTKRVGAVREWVLSEGAADLTLLGDTADALKHAVLTYRLPREVEEAGQVLAVSRGYGSGRYGEGKFGGVDQVWILSRSGRRPLGSILRSVEEVWLNLLSR